MLANLGYLERHVETQNMHRFYSIHITPTLFGDHALIKINGRVGSQGRKREVWFDSPIQALEEGLKIRQRKIRKGYNAPLKLRLV